MTPAEITASLTPAQKRVILAMEPLIDYSPWALPFPCAWPDEGFKETLDGLKKLGVVKDILVGTIGLSIPLGLHRFNYLMGELQTEITACALEERSPSFDLVEQLDEVIDLAWILLGKIR